MNPTTATDLTVAAWPGCPPRLLRTDGGVEDHADYAGAGGYRPLADPDALWRQVRDCRVRGRGGAAFPLATKLASVRDNAAAAGGAVVVANGEEGEPTSIKDRWLLRHRPHLVLDGLRLAARIVGAARGCVYVSDPAAAAAVHTALDQLGGAPDGLPVRVVRVEPGYVAGEETAAVRAIDGGPAKPTDKPPRPFESGVAGLPTLVSNVETLAQLAWLHSHGAEAFRSVGTDAAPGTFLATVTGAGRPPALYEIPYGAPFAELLAVHGVAAERVSGALAGGYFAGLLDTAVLGATLDHESLQGLGSGLGCGAISLLTDECPVAVAAAVMAYFDRSNAGQCGSCFNGTAAMAAVTAALRDGVATDEDVARLRRWSQVLRGRGACGTLDAATNVAASLLDRFPQQVRRHLAGDCADCRDGAFRADRPYEVEAVGGD